MNHLQHKILLTLILMLSMVNTVFASVKRTRLDGLHNVISSSTGGINNLHLTLYGRTFLWDNAAASKIPPAMPTGDLSYGLLDFLDVTLGMQALSYGTQPGYLRLQIKATTPNNKNIRFVGAALALETKKNLFDRFPSNGFRVGAEGFGPEGFLLGNNNAISSWKTTAAGDIDLIKITAWLPVKLMGNIGYETSFSSPIADSVNSIDRRQGTSASGTTDFSKLPILFGLEYKTYNTDFFAEIEAELYYQNAVTYMKGLVTGDQNASWVRYRIPNKVIDMHVLESPIYASMGAKLKYDNGLSLQGGFSWLLSLDRGPVLGPCTSVNRCRDNEATDGYSPFYPQWKVFALIRYPLLFTQPGSEMYRNFLLKRQVNSRKTLDIEGAFSNEKASERDTDREERLKAIEERRKMLRDDETKLN